MASENTAKKAKQFIVLPYGRTYPVLGRFDTWKEAWDFVHTRKSFGRFTCTTIREAT